MTPSTTAITEALPTEKQVVASALNDTVRELGGALGVALLGSVLSSSYQSSISATTEQLPAELRGPVKDGIGIAQAVSDRLGDDAVIVVNAAREAFVDGWRTSMWVGVALKAVGFAYVAVREHSSSSRSWSSPRRPSEPRSPFYASLTDHASTCSAAAAPKEVYVVDDWPAAEPASSVADSFRGAGTRRRRPNAHPAATPETEA